MSISITGALVNAAAIVLGSVIGLLLKGRIPKHLADSIIRVIALCVCVVGISGAIKGDTMLLVVSLALGAFIGELLRIEGGINKLGQWLQQKLSRKEENSTFSEGFVTATLLFCVGAMAIVGSIESGLGNDRSIIFTKSIMDGVTSVMLASTLGLGVLFSAAAILVYQGSIELSAGYLQNVLIVSVCDFCTVCDVCGDSLRTKTHPLITQISAVGGVMIFGIGLNMVLNAKIRVANLLPGLLVAVGYYYLFMA